MANLVLSDGKKVEISSVLLNKDQNINVSKTYVTTVKKAVTKVSEDFYKVEDTKKDESTSSQIFEAMKDDVFASPADVQSAVESASVLAENSEPAIPELPQVEPIIPTVPVTNVVDLPKVENEKEILPVDNIVEPAVMPVAPTTVVPEPILPVTNIDSEELPKINNVSSDLPKVENEKEILPVTNVVEPEVKPVLEPIQPVASVPVVEPISPVQPEVKEESVVSPEPVISVQQPVKQDAQEPKLFFDGSKETNLNMALGEVSEEKTMATESEGVQALRQFGSDEPVTALQEVMPLQEDVKTLTRSKGFANNKFFMVIAIAFFVAACVFLGYEAFQYFQIKG